ncbi:MAG: hypothetical protein GOV01_01830, partial [Candidatus Altiarchaeota archaeon]|nr:hypothetical protein [Candidatus Altiarchaeota archaeon]
MKGQLSVELILIISLAIASSSLLFVFIRGIVMDSQSGIETVLVYPEEIPQIASLRCYLEYGYAAVQS